MEKGKISSLQMAIILYFIMLATATLSLPSVAGKMAKQDLWLSPIWATSVGFLSLFIFLGLNKYYPGENILQFSERIIGKFAGKTLGLLYLFFHLYLNGIVLRQYAEFMVIYLPKTPLFVIITTMVIVCAYVVYGGVEVLGRAAQVFLPLYFLPLVLMAFLLLPEMKFENILPIMEKGILPSIKGAIPVQAWFNDMFYVSFFLPFLTNPEKGRKWSIISIITVLFTMIITNLTAIFVLGRMIPQLVYPIMSMSSYISIANFFEHIESMMMVVWVTGIFVKVSAVYYVVSLGTAQYLNIKEYKPFVFPLGILQVLFTFWVSHNFQELVAFLSTSGIFYFFFIEIILPLLLLSIALIKNQLKKKKYIL